MTRYNSSVVNALLDTYPDIGLEVSEFEKKPSMSHDLLRTALIIVTGGYWDDEKNRKQFFDKFASKMGFDPLHPENWYTVTAENITEEVYHY